MGEADIRWQQRLSNYSKALEQLGNAIMISRQQPLSDLEKLGQIHTFAFTHELAWNVMKDYFAWQGNSGITSSPDAAREAFQKGLVEDGEGWMEMIRSRNQTTHTYQQKIADEIAGQIGGCKTFCVNGHLAGNCRLPRENRNDRKQRTDRQPAG